MGGRSERPVHLPLDYYAVLASLPSAVNSEPHEAVLAPDVSNPGSRVGVDVAFSRLRRPMIVSLFGSWAQAGRSGTDTSRRGTRHSPGGREGGREGEGKGRRDRRGEGRGVHLEEKSCCVRPTVMMHHEPRPPRFRGTFLFGASDALLIAPASNIDSAPQTSRAINQIQQPSRLRSPFPWVFPVGPWCRAPKPAPRSLRRHRFEARGSTTRLC